MRLGARQEFHGDIVHRPGCRRKQQEKQVHIERCAARPHDDQNPDKPDHDRAPAAKPHIFVQDQNGRHSGKERGGEVDSGSRRQWHHRDPIKPGRRRDEADPCAQQKKPPVPASQQKRSALDDPRKNEKKPEQAPKEGDLEWVHCLRGDADEHIHHDRTDPAEHDPQCGAGDRRKPRRRQGE